MDNSITIIGGVVREPEMKFMDSGQATAKFSLAVDNGYMKDGAWVKKVSYFDVVVYGKLAENCAETLKPGYRACAQGKLEQRSWDTDEGKRYVIELKADDVSLSLKFVTAIVERGEKPEAPKREFKFDDQDPF
jgi:single-strand DNA-binding protein